MNKILSLFVFGMFLCTATAEKASNEKCPVSGQAVDAEQTVTLTRTIGFCCGKCLSKFEKDPSAIAGKVLALAPKEGPVNASCPVKGKAVDASSKTVDVGGQTVAVCCGGCAKKLKANPDKFEVKASALNEKCLYSNQDIDTGKTATFTRTVGFCCGKCKAKFQKNPASFAEKL